MSKDSKALRQTTIYFSAVLHPPGNGFFEQADANDLQLACVLEKPDVPHVRLLSSSVRLLDLR